MIAYDSIGDYVCVNYNNSFLINNPNWSPCKSYLICVNANRLDAYTLSISPPDNHNLLLLNSHISGACEYCPASTAFGCPASEIQRYTDYSRFKDYFNIDNITTAIDSYMGQSDQNVFEFKQPAFIIEFHESTSHYFNGTVYSFKYQSAHFNAKDCSLKLDTNAQSDTLPIPKKYLIKVLQSNVLNI